ncbi:MAG: helix-turn-helix domain-containing protein [Phocaeicola sp.]|uniref:helix-turn-helix domain-containing protein n=1 Tax=Phocaeicola TaxID=909656 RepID=UPI00234E8411|nr:helix-turn-helix domain-containing protein [Phocaeicola oris]MCE2616938.1 helix-turn-helix domain-containing protein [Phocaeicola oris]
MDIADKFIFTDNIFQWSDYCMKDYLPHIFCMDGSLNFVLDGKPYYAVDGDCIIPSILKPAYQITPSEDFRCRIMFIDAGYIDQNKPVMHYNVIGHLGLIQNPIIHLLPAEFQMCLENVDVIRKRFLRSYHSFYLEALRTAFQAFVLDMYDIHCRQGGLKQVGSSQAEVLVRRFIAMLQEGGCRTHRSPSYYADKLYITPIYLTEICRRVTHNTPTYWIDYFTASEIKTLLADKNLSLQTIADQLGFSSLAYFSRYCTKLFDNPPSRMR